MLRSVSALAVIFALGSAAGARTAAAPATVSGIPLDAPWKATVYRFARAHFHHPAWGWQHSERDYRLAVEIARREHLTVDTDVLFAAAMLHDMAGFPPWEKKGVEHGYVAAITSGPVLRAAGFPMTKFAAVQAAERGHMFYSEAVLPEAVALHDADSVDFLGVMGVTRMLAITGEKAAGVGDSVATLQAFVKRIPPRLKTRAAREMAIPRVAEMNRFLDALARESDGLR